jgi:hypothetical protein
MRPALPFAVVWLAVAGTLSWLAVLVGGFWLSLPPRVAEYVAPLWFAASTVLAYLDEPYVRE